MNRTITPRPTRRAPTGALILFGLAYLGALVFIFAPEGSLSSRNVAAVPVANE